MANLFVNMLANNSNIDDVCEYACQLIQKRDTIKKYAF